MSNPADETPERPADEHSDSPAEDAGDEATAESETPAPGGRESATVPVPGPAAAKSDEEAEWLAEEAQRNDFVLRWGVVLLAFLAACTPIVESETLVHVRSGEYMLSHGVLPPRTDVFSYTADDRTWINTAWLFDVVAAGVHAVGGGIGLTLFKALLAALVFGFVVHTNRRGAHTWWGSLAAVLAIAVCAPRFTALPELVTLLGLAVAFWIVERWRAEGDSGSLWWLVPVFLLWANLDPRVFLGLAVLLAFGLGELLAPLLRSPAAFAEDERRSFWLVFAGCVAACLVNPFGWETLLEPVRLYGTVYPEMRALAGDEPSFRMLQFFPVTTPEFATTFGVHAVSALLLVTAAFVAFAVNHRRLDMAAMLALTLAVALAAAALHELAAAALVASIVFTFTIQDWSLARGTTTEPSRKTVAVERAGRVVAVVLLVAVGGLAINGRLLGTPRIGIGVGFHRLLAGEIEGLDEAVEDLPHELRVFNFTTRQGDRLIWLGRKVFVDGRVGLYAGGEDDVLDRHRTLRRGLGGDPGADPEAVEELLDEYDLAVALPRLGGDYGAYAALRRDSDWTLSRLTSATAAFVRTSAPSPAAAEFLAAHEFDAVEAAFGKAVEPVPPRVEFGREGAGGGSWFRPDTRESVPALQRARHFTAHLQLAMQGELGGDRGISRPEALSYVYLVLRDADRALAEDPQLAQALNVLGRTRTYLVRQVERSYFQERDSEGRAVLNEQAYQSLFEFRFLQSVGELGQAARVDPKLADPHFELFRLYVENGQRDLALRHANEFVRLREDDPAGREDPRLRQIREGNVRSSLQEAVQAVAEGVDEARQKDQQPVNLAQIAHRNGCVSMAIDLLEESFRTNEQVAQAPQARLFYARLLLEAGRPADAFDVLSEFENRAAAGPDVTRLFAIACACGGRFEEATNVLDSQLRQLEWQRAQVVLDALPFTAAPPNVPRPLSEKWVGSWPVNSVASLRAAAVASRPLLDTAAQLLVLQIESGRLEEARDLVERMLESYPGGHNARLMLQYAELLDVTIEPPREE